MLIKFHLCTIDMGKITFVVLLIIRATSIQLISNKVRMPTGLLKWCLDFELSECQIKTALMFTNKCSLSVYDRVFQYKIATNILLTNAYLYRYKVKDTLLVNSVSWSMET